ncbi:Microtubule bundling protein [Sporothrix epigloea]|uniref:Microtubule bundling protein n=1 Tax=Sporothrix epigloea TaxID=1892477 RepID=A0ABP0DEE0_9PEZI
MDASYLSQQVNGIIDQLHGLFDEIGVSKHEREAREEELFNALSEALHNQVRLVTTEKKNMVEDAQRTIAAIRQMEASLDDSRSRRDYDADQDLQVSYPLTRCLQVLKEKHLQISKIHRERFEQVRKLVEALESYSSHLESSFVRIALPPTAPKQSIPINFDLSPSYVDKLDAEFTRVYEEYNCRVATVKSLAEDVIQLWAELGTSQAQTDTAIVNHYRESPEQLGLHEDDISRLRSRRDKLADEKKAREKRLRDLKLAVEVLWGKLNIEEHEKKAFLNGNRGCGIRQINEFEDELARLNELKRQNLPTFVEDARCRLQELWDVLYLSEDEMLEFTPAFSDVYSDALLEAHEREIGRLEALKEQRAPTLAMIDRHHTLAKERDELAASSQDASRLMMRGQKGEKRDPGKLLREEKTRKRIAKELPKVTTELRKALEAWEDEYGRPFLVYGERYLDTLYEGAANSTRPSGAPSAAPGPRSKTPANPSVSTVKSTIKRTPGVSAAMSSAARPPRNVPSRAGAKTPIASMASAGGLIKRSETATSVATITNGRASPSRIPAATKSRVPLGTLKHGSNSPERPRAGAPVSAAAADLRCASNAMSDMLRQAPSLVMAPPPKMRELIRVPHLETSANPYRGTNLGSGVNVRRIELEDVYEDRYGVDRYDNEVYEDRSQTNSSQTHAGVRPSSQQSYTSQQYRQLQQAQQQQPHVGPVRHISNTSTTVSGSENWETYDDYSEPEPDASEGYYAKMRAARGKRMTPDIGSEYGAGGRPPSNMANKRQRGIPPPASTPYAGQVMMDASSNRVMSGSEWTDEDAF